VTAVRKAWARRRLQEMGTLEEEVAGALRMELTDLAGHGMDELEVMLVKGGGAVGSTRCMIHRPSMRCCHN